MIPSITAELTMLIRDIVELAVNVAEEAPNPSNDTNETDQDNLTDIGASPMRPSRVTVAFIVLTVGFCVLSFSYLLYHPPALVSHLSKRYIRPSLSHFSDHLPSFIIIIHQRFLVLFQSVTSKMHLPSVRTTLLPTTIGGAFGSSYRKFRQRRRGAPFRVGENRLVQWAHEDMGLLDEEMELETDFMVNAQDVSEAEDLGLTDEYIPLTVGMGMGRGGRGTQLPVRNYGSATVYDL